MVESIAEYFSRDHGRLDNLFKGFLNFKKSDFSQAKELFKEFKTSLQRHIVWEEDLLFPAFEKKTGMTNAGPTAVMRSEHIEIGGFLEQIHEKIKENNLNSDSEERNLLSALSHHNLKEEKILYPSIDGLLKESERKEIFEAMKNIPKERYKCCCQISNPS
ncbi:MAG: hemerythrin domain-containing protein [Candidatus Melainabacteria bacterium]|nr:hemerythrin domain-containing protein [Candidatus Melainabacteria bacterium]